MTQQYGPTPAVATPQPLYAQYQAEDHTIPFVPDNTSDYGGGAGLGVPFGAVLVLGKMVAVATHYIPPLLPGALTIRGKITLPKTNPDATLIQGARWYWDNTNHVATTVASGNTYGGKVSATAANTDTTVDCILLSAANNVFGPVPVTTVAAAGSALADAAQLSSGFNVVTGADGTKGVKLPATPQIGDVVFVKGTTSATLKVWPDAAATINAIGANGSISLTTVCPAIFIAVSATQWYTIPLVPS